MDNLPVDFGDVAMKPPSKYGGVRAISTYEIRRDAEFYRRDACAAINNTSQATNGDVLNGRSFHSLNQGGHQTFGGVLFGFQRGLELEGVDGLGGFRADGGDLQMGKFLMQFRQVEAGMKMFHRGTAGEGDPIRAFRGKPRGGAGGVFGFRDRLVDGDVIHNGAIFRERLRQFGRGHFGAKEAHLYVLDVLVFFKGLNDFFDGVFLRHEVHLQMQFTQFGRGSRANGGDAGPADIAKIWKTIKKEIKERIHAVPAGKDEPFVAVQFHERIHDGIT